MARIVLGVVLYAVLAFLIHLCLKLWEREEAGSGERGRWLHIFFVIAWPLTVLGFIFHVIRRSRDVLPDSYNPPEENRIPFARWKRSKPRSNYNDASFGPEGGGDALDAESMAAFLEHLSRRPDAPLPQELTFGYKLTGISKTYPAGTMFPSALISDWKRGYFMGGETAGTGDFPQ